MNVYVSSIPVLLLAFVATGGDDGARLKGKWRIIERVSDGRSMPADELKKIEVVIDADMITVTIGDRVEKYPYTLDPKAKPPAIDLRSIDGKKQAMPGIYELKGDTLRIYVSPDGDRPKAFPAKSEPGNTLLVLERIKN